MKQTPIKFGSVLPLILALFAVIITSGSFIDFGEFNWSVAFAFGVIIFLIFVCSPIRRFQAFPLSMAVVFFVPDAIGLFINREIGIETYVLIYNLLIFYCLTVLLLALPNKQVNFVMASFVAGFLAFASWHFAINDYHDSRFFYGSFNPNDVAVVGLLSLTFTYVLSVTFTNGSCSGVYTTLVKILTFPAIITIISLITVTGTRFAIITSVIVSLAPILKPKNSVSANHNSKYQTILFATGLFFSVAALIGVGGFKHVSDRLEWSAEAENIFYKVKGPLGPLVYDLGKVDGSISSLGGRMPAWRLAYYMSLHSPLNVIGANVYDAERTRLKVPSPHNYLVKSYIASGIFGASFIAGILIFATGFFAREFFCNDKPTYLIWGCLVVISMMMNLWYLKPVWFAFSILVYFVMSRKT